MNSPSTIPAPPTTAAEPLVATCPRCSTQLQLLRRPIEFTPIKCFHCQAMFCLEPVETLPVGPSVGSVNSVLPGSRNAESSGNLPPMSLPPTPPAIAPTMVFSAPPPPPPSAPVRPVSAPTLIATAPQAAPRSSAPPAPPPPASPTVAPGLPVPNEISKKPQLLLDLGPMESLIAVTLTVAVVTGLIIGGYYAYRVLSPSNTPEHAPAAQTAAPSPDAIDMTQKNMAAGPITMPRIPRPPADAEKKSESLIGYWVSRADDGSVAILDLQKDGVAVYTGASSDPTDARGLRGKWALIEHQNDDVVIDILYAATGLELHRISLHIVSPDCFLVTRSAFRGIVDSPDQRFIRGTRPAT